MSWNSPGGQASTATGPVPTPQVRESAPSLRRRRLLAKCSWAIPIRPSSHISPIRRRRGRTTSMIALSTDRSTNAVSRTAWARSSSSAVTASRSWATSIGGSARRLAGPGRCRPRVADRSGRRRGRCVAARVEGGGAGALGGQHPAGGLDGAHALVAQGDDLADPALVLGAVEPVPTGRAHGLQQAVPALPGTQHVGADADLGRQLPNPHRRRDRTSHDSHGNAVSQI